MEWLEKYPEEVRELEIFKGSKDEETMIKRLGDQQSYVSQALRVPGEDAGDEDWKAFDEKLTTKVPHLMRTPDPDNDESVVSTLRSLGAPEEVGGYAPPTLEVDEGMTQNEGIVEVFKTSAHKHNLTQKQFAGVLEDVHKNSVEAERVRITDFNNDRATLQKDWGAVHDQNMDAITVFMTKTDAPAALLKVAEFGDAATLDWLHRITKAVNGEKVSVASDGKTTKPAPMTPAEATQKISEIRNNKKHPYNNAGDPGHAAAKTRMRQLYIYADPENATKRATAA